MLADAVKQKTGAKVRGIELSLLAAQGPDKRFAPGLCEIKDYFARTFLSSMVR